MPPSERGAGPPRSRLSAYPRRSPWNESAKLLNLAYATSAKIAFRSGKSKAPLVEGLDATWHLVGHLQRNKAARAIRLFHTIDSLDSLPLAEKLNQIAGEGRRLPVLIEVRLDPTATKLGCAPAELPRLAEGVLLMPHLELRGLMTIPPMTPEPEGARPIFRKLREMRDGISQQLKCPLAELSMGMSRDFDIAIEEGATQVRLGTALFGARHAAR